MLMNLGQVLRGDEGRLSLGLREDVGAGKALAQFRVSCEQRRGSSRVPGIRSRRITNRINTVVQYEIERLAVVRGCAAERGEMKFRSILRLDHQRLFRTDTTVQLGGRIRVALVAKLIEVRATDKVRGSQKLVGLTVEHPCKPLFPGFRVGTRRGPVPEAVMSGGGAGMRIKAGHLPGCSLLLEQDWKHPGTITVRFNNDEGVDAGRKTRNGEINFIGAAGKRAAKVCLDRVIRLA